MTNKNPFLSHALADLEANVAPFAAAPHLARRRAVAGNQQVAVPTVRHAVFEALVASGYDTLLAEKMASEVAEQVPAIEQKFQSVG